MGTWGHEPWANDQAADWYAELFEKTKLSDHIEQTLQSNISDNYDEIRAAAFVLVVLGRINIWPIEVLNKHLNSAVEKLEGILNDKTCPLNEDDDIINAIKEDIVMLKKRMDG
jgi:hypothetical protein